MTSLSYGSNVGSLLAQTNLRKTTDALSTSFERLSSGLRINSAKDDPAGYALANDLNVKARVYTQAIRNANDGISLLSVAEAAASELTSILSRLSELATQASNGSLTRIQRVALDDEAQELTEEYNRIIGNTEFNTRSLLDGSFESTTLQVSDSSQNNISFEVGEELGLTVGDGTFQSQLTESISSFTQALHTTDINGDGREDLVFANSATSIHVHLGNGDGTFGSAISSSTGAFISSLELGDLNGDGNIDAVTHSFTTNDVHVSLGNGDGTFAAHVSFAVSNVGGDLSLGDFDGDGDLDVVTFDQTADDLLVLLNDGNGSFGSAITSDFSGVGFAGLDVGDINEDGIVDLVLANNSGSSVFLAISNGDGTFQNAGTLSTGSSPNSVILEDFNHDGTLDIASVQFGSDAMEVFLGNGDGSFSYVASYSTGGEPTTIDAADLNGDGHLDLAVRITDPDDEVEIFFGSGTGSFTKSSESYTVSDSLNLSEQLAIADFNGDNVADIATIAQNDDEVSILLGNSQEIQTLPRLDLARADSALASLEIIERVQDNLTLELGNIGAVSSRLDFTTSVLTNIRDEYTSAESRIIDADVASEVAEMVRLQVLQQAGAAVLAQANTSPQIALTLLASGS